MALNVKFLRGTAERFAAIAKDANTFYLVTTTSAEGQQSQDLYLGDVKLSNGTDLAAAVARVAQNEKDIDAIEKQLQDLVGSGTGSIQDMITASVNAAKTELNKSIKANEDAIKAINDETNGILAQAKAHADGKDTAIAAAKKAGDDAQADVDALELKVGTVADGETVVGMISKASTDAKVTLATAATATEGYLKTYVISQGTTEVGKIDIPKELVVTGGEVVVNPAGQPAGTYVKLTIANQDDPIFINVKDLVDVYTAAQGAAQVQLAISETNEISATIVAGSIGTTELADKAVTAAKLADDAKALFDEAGAAADAETAAKGHADGLNTAMDTRMKVVEAAVGQGGSVQTQITTAIEGLDADVTSAAVETGKGLQVQVVETDGEITAVNVTGNFNEAYDAKGAAAAAETAAKTAAATDATTKANAAETNAKKHADDLNTAMDLRMDAVEQTAGSAVQDVVSGTANGTVNVDGTDVAVTGLKSAAYADANSFDAAGSATAAQKNATDYTDAALTWNEF